MINRRQTDTEDHEHQRATHCGTLYAAFHYHVRQGETGPRFHHRAMDRSEVKMDEKVNFGVFRVRGAQ